MFRFDPTPLGGFEERGEDFEIRADKIPTQEAIGDEGLTSNVARIVIRVINSLCLILGIPYFSASLTESIKSALMDAKVYPSQPRFFSLCFRQVVHEQQEMISQSN